MTMVSMDPIQPKKAIPDVTFWVLFGLAALACLWGVLLTRIYVMDDALITLRYSFNFVRFGIPIWNQADLGNPSMGYTSFLWMSLNALPALITSNKDVLIFVAKAFSFTALLVIIWVFCKEISQLYISTSLKVVLVLVIFTQFGYGLHVNSAMETILFSLLSLLSVRAYGKGHPVQAYLYGALSFLTRPEGALLCALIFLADLINRKYKRIFMAGSAFVLLLAGLFVLLRYWYGDFLPNTFYVKQEIYDPLAIKRSLFFIATLALPYLILSIHSAISLRNRMSIYMLIAALVYIGYYMTVFPSMNVLSRYQWPSLVLLTYGSIPSMEYLAQNFRKYRLAAVILLIMAIGLNTGNALGASYFANATGSAEQNLIRIGKTMFSYRQLEGWLVYHDAGAVSYFSDWNTHETIGLTNGPLARHLIRLEDLYKNPDSIVVLHNFDLTDPGQIEKQKTYTDIMASYGFHFIQNIPILYVEGQRNFVVAFYAKDINMAHDLLAHMTIEKSFTPDFSFSLYKIAKNLVGR